MSVLPVGNAKGGGSAAAYSIDYSALYDSATDSLTRTTTSAPTDGKKWTYSGWFKLVEGAHPNGRGLMSDAGAAGDDLIMIYQDTFYWGEAGAGYQAGSHLLRDYAGWYHFVIVYDSTEASSANRLKFYHNNIQDTGLDASYITLNEVSSLTANSNAIRLFDTWTAGTELFAYVAELHFVDGQALTPGDFGEEDANGVWQPKAYSGTYGNNGFYLDFSNGADLGEDQSGNNNDWTNSGGSQETDTPTNNQVVINPLWHVSSTSTLSNGNRTVNTPASGNGPVVAAMAVPSSGKWYWEVKQESTNGHIGIVETTSTSTTYVGTGSGDWAYTTVGGAFSLYNNGTGASYGDSFTTNDVIGVALDMDGGNLYFYKNGTIQNSGTAAATGLTGEYYPAFSDGAGTAHQGTFRFNEDEFTQSIPSGYQALNATNIRAEYAITKPTDNFDVVTYTGNGSTQSISSLDFQPDLVWIKNRDATDSHQLIDAVRGATKELNIDNVTTEATNSDGLTSFDSNGFSLGADLEYNTNSEDYVAWCWKADNTTGSSNTDGSITSTVAANTAAGFSIVKYTGTGANATVGHGLGVAPDLIILKASNSGTLHWAAYHSSNTSAPETDYLLPSFTNATADDATVWQDTAPTSSVFSIGTNITPNTNTVNYIAYCFANIPGYQHCGAYTGNSSTDGVYINCGFRPAFIYYKRTDAAGHGWVLWDTSRNTYNVVDKYLLGHTTSAEATLTTLDIVSNGFKLRTTNASNNAGSIAYIAIAESNDLSRAR